MDQGGLGSLFHSRDSSRVRKCIQYQKFLITCWEVGQVFDEGWKWLLWECYQGFFLNQWKLIRGQTKNSAKIYWGPCCSRRKQEQVNSFPCSLPEPGQQVGSLHRMKGEVYPGVGPDRWLRWFAHPLSGVVFKGHAQYLAFSPGSSEVATGVFWVFSILLFLICLNCNIVVLVVDQ